ncbi:ATP-binding protein [Actinomadura namibiensis]|uniref:DNA-binding CsgD family transcriptional regulator/tetratricopeptide (TPR) repeat protein n=1 Tax=Actinomadura namibiensis TaxID=182080 RepID=A0A7W3LP38_ACTNM|nr:LuxR family transcriptional regulator [Actinomadura namibiensis]MBA8951647.1 DNA-binding CsgD family transcriptional regulator/tetratricopeptide (TPR) repeat protein [Actinomadura namibiensis]
MTLGESPAMVGREAESALVGDLVAGAAGGRGGMLMVLGEAGIGKSLLLAGTAARARAAGMLVLTGRAVQGGGAYRPLAEALIGLLRDEPPDAVAELRPYRAALGRLLPCWAGEGEPPPPLVDPVVVLGEGLARLLSLLNGGRGCLLVLEDLHWADADTLAVLEYLAGAVRELPVLVAGSARDEEHQPCRGGRVLDRPETTAVRLRRLDPAGVVELARRRAGTADLPEPVRRLVLDKSDGLPFLVEELVAGALEGSAPAPVPPTLAGLVDARLAALDPGHRRVVEAAAVVGGEPDPAVLGPVTGLDETTVLAALRAGRPRLLVPAGDALRWRHALTREAVLAAVPPPERSALARRAAAALLDRGAPDDEARAADLLAAGGDRDGAGAIYLRLARRDLARGALRDAHTMLARAGSLSGGPRAAVVVERVRLLTLTGRAGEALETGAAALPAATGDDHARLCLRLADAALALRRWPEAERLLARAGRPADPHALVLAAGAAFGPGDLTRAAALATDAIARARRAGDGEALCRALIALGRCATSHDPPAARATYGHAAQVAAEHGLTPWRIAALTGLAAVEGGAHPALAEARELALEAGLLAEVVACDLLRAKTICTAEGPRAAAPLARRTAGRAARLRLSGARAVAELLVAFAHAADADDEGMDRALTTAADLPDAPIEVAALTPAVSALRRLLDRDLAEADRLLDSGMRRLVGRPQAAPVPLWGLWALLRTVHGSDDARTTLRRSSAVLRGVNQGVLHYADAVAAGRAGRSGRAAELLAMGDLVLAEHPWWRRLCRLLALEAAVADGWGDPVPVLRADLDVFDRAGEPRLARTCRDLLRRAGAPTRRGRGRTPVPAPLRAAGVTSREMDVLELVAAGLTNRQIAERLFLSHRTVDTHVASLLAKTGTTCRNELSARTNAQLT